MSTKKKEDKYTLETRFYNNPFSFSYSSLSKLLYSPRLFYKDYILNEKEEKLSESPQEDFSSNTMRDPGFTDPFSETLKGSSVIIINRPVR